MNRDLCDGEKWTSVLAGVLRREGKGEASPDLMYRSENAVEANSCSLKK